MYSAAGILITQMKDQSGIFVTITSHDSEVCRAIRQDIELGRNIMQINRFPKFYKNRTTIV